MMTAAVCVIAPGHLQAAEEVTGDDALNALNAVFGRHAGERGSHAKGFCVAGQFTPTEEGRETTNVTLFDNPTIPVTARFSIGGGNPHASDTKRSARGFAIRFEPDSGDEMDLVLLSVPTFFAATPEEFLEFLKIRTKDPVTGKKDKAKIAAYNASHPNAHAHINYLENSPPPASYATTPYFSIHAFLVKGADGHAIPARWILEPVGGLVGLTEEEEKDLSGDFLKAELSERLSKSITEWDIHLQIGEDGDSLTDPTTAWPDTRKRVNMGRLVIDHLIAEDSDADCTDYLFDPNNLASGIEATDDPILALRSPTYGASFSHRLAD